MQFFPESPFLPFSNKARIHIPYLCFTTMKANDILTLFKGGPHLVRSQRKLPINQMWSIKDFCPTAQLFTDEYSVIKYLLTHSLFTGGENSTLIWKYIKQIIQGDGHHLCADLFQYWWQRCFGWALWKHPGLEGSRIDFCPCCYFAGWASTLSSVFFPCKMGLVIPPRRGFGRIKSSVFESGSVF